MNFDDKETQISQALTVCAELTGTQLSSAALNVMLDDLLDYDLSAVLEALNRCRRELTGRLTLAAVLQRIDSGLPSADEAFGMLVDGWRNEALTVVVPKIAMEAAGNGAWDLFAAGDKTGARMAFRQAYERLAARVRGKPEWFVSKGHDRCHQAAAVMAAVKAGRLSAESATLYLPTEAGEERHLLETGRMLTDEERQRGRQMLEQAKLLLESKAVGNA